MFVLLFYVLSTCFNTMIYALLKSPSQVVIVWHLSHMVIPGVNGLSHLHDDL